MKEAAVEAAYLDLRRAVRKGQIENCDGDDFAEPVARVATLSLSRRAGYREAMSETLTEIYGAEDWATTTAEDDEDDDEHARHERSVAARLAEEAR